jgi:hypothetical protein
MCRKSCGWPLPREAKPINVWHWRHTQLAAISAPQAFARHHHNLVVVKQNDNEVAESKIMIFGSIAITTNLTITHNFNAPS